MAARTKKLRQKWEKRKIGRPQKPKKLGDRISFKLTSGKRVSGTVIGVRKEFYYVMRKGQIYKVNKRSIFYALGRAIGTATAKGVGFASEIYRAYKEERKRHEQWRRRRARQPPIRTREKLRRLLRR